MISKLLAVLFLFSLISIANAQIKIVPIASNLNQPTDIAHSGDGCGKLFFALQHGKIVVYNGTSVLSTPFLNISSSISCCGEKGLLSLAFHPNYKTNGLFYILYTSPATEVVVAQYKRSSNPNIANASSRRILLKIPSIHHYGGELQFGKDGHLYVSIGDGQGGDPNENSQNLGDLHGKILRIGVNGGSYFIPSTNPFVNKPGARKEIWAYGLRNPWRFSFDSQNGNMYVADVGQDGWEEINYQVAGSGGQNYGWRKMEGKHCFHPASNCNNGSLKLPILEYSHSQGCSITGGYVYRGNKIPTLLGSYVYADFCAGILYGVKKSSEKWIASQLLSTGKKISTFGQDAQGELYFAHYASPGGVIYRIDKK